MIRINILLLFLFLFNLNCSSSDEGLELIKDKKFPRWLKDNNVRTSQTSGIAYIGKSNSGDKLFMLADDIGAIYRLSLKSDSSIKLKKIKFSDKAAAYLNSFPKKDFEDIAYDKYTKEVIISIEGNDPDFKKYVGIYKLKFENNDVMSNKIVSIEKINVEPENNFLELTANNVGFEGLAVDDRYIYAGLESASENVIFSTKAKIYIIDKQTYHIVKIVDTEDLNISTVTGLYSPKNYELLGIDRNGKRIFYLKFNKALDITESSNMPVTTNIPDYPGFEYGASLESITMDSENNLYLVDDPWKINFIPSENIFSQLDNNTKNNFSNLIPIIYKFYLNLH